MKTRLMAAILIFAILVLVLTELPVLASIGDVLWSRKCESYASVIVTELEDGTNLVECFLYIERGK